MATETPRPRIDAKPLLGEPEPSIELSGAIDDVAKVLRQLGVSKLPILGGPAGKQPLRVIVTGPSPLGVLLAVRLAGDRAGVVIRFAGCP